MQLFALITAIFMSFAGYGMYLRANFVEPAPIIEPVPIVEDVPVPEPVATTIATTTVTATSAPVAPSVPIAPKPSTKKVAASSGTGRTSTTERKAVVLPVPTGLTAYVLLSGDVELTWNALAGSGIRYRIYRDSIEIGATKYTFYADADIPNAYSHRYAVSAYDDIGSMSGRTALVSPLKKPVVVASASPSPATAPISSTPATPTTPTTPTPATPSQTTPTSVNGSCGSANGKSYSSAPSSGLCSTGSAGSVASGASTYTWSCAGSGGGSTASCAANVSAPAPINGACGSASGGSFANAPTSGLCSSGSASAVSTGSSYTWTCAGGSGGSTASCIASVSAPVSACGSGGACSAAQVAAHASASDCWVYLSPINKVYNITSYVANGSAQHPGGNVITPYCGKNMYSAFVNGSPGGHRHSNSALNSVLQAYYIGPLQ